jgi:hypothetical protein
MSTPKKIDIIVDGAVAGQILDTGDFTQNARLADEYLKKNGIIKVDEHFDVIFAQALSFANTARNLQRDYLRVENFNVEMFVPFVVNAAFGVELFLKALSAKHGLVQRGHELLKLHDSLPSSALASISKAAAARLNESEDIGSTEFRRNLEPMDKMFVEWRYFDKFTDFQSVDVFKINCVTEIIYAAYKSK